MRPGPYADSYVLSFYNRPNSLLSRPVCPESHVSSPREEVSEVLSVREPKRLWLYCPKPRHMIGQLVHHVTSGDR